MKFILGIIVLIVAGVVGSKCHESLQKDIIKKALDEHEKEKMDKKP